MKKSTFIIAIVIILVACIGVGTFAAWDTLSTDKVLEVSVGSNVNISANITEKPDIRGKVLVPAGTDIFLNKGVRVSRLEYGSVEIKNNAANDNAPAYGVPNMGIRMSLAAVEFRGKSNPNSDNYDKVYTEFNLDTFNSYLKVELFSGATPGSQGLVLDTSDPDYRYAKLLLDTSYLVCVSFKDNSSAYDPINDPNIAKLYGCRIKITLKFTAVDNDDPANNKPVSPAI